MLTDLVFEAIVGVVGRLADHLEGGDGVVVVDAGRVRDQLFEVAGQQQSILWQPLHRFQQVVLERQVLAARPGLELAQRLGEARVFVDALVQQRYLTAEVADVGRVQFQERTLKPGRKK